MNVALSTIKVGITTDVMAGDVAIRKPIASMCNVHFAGTINS